MKAPREEEGGIIAHEVHDVNRIFIALSPKALPTSLSRDFIRKFMAGFLRRHFSISPHSIFLKFFTWTGVDRNGSTGGPTGGHQRLTGGLE